MSIVGILTNTDNIDIPLLLLVQFLEKISGCYGDDTDKVTCKIFLSEFLSEGNTSEHHGNNFSLTAGYNQYIALMLQKYL